MATKLQTEQGIVRVPTGTWHVDPTHSSVEFEVKHMMIATVRGQFREFEGRLEAAEDDPAKFNMAHMGMRLAQRANGVSSLHGRVSRMMFNELWPGFDPGEVPGEKRCLIRLGPAGCRGPGPGRAGPA